MNMLQDIYRIYPAYIKINLVKNLQYQAELAIWLIGRILQPIIYLVIWTTVARANGGAVASFSVADFAAYFIIEMLVNDATSTAIMWEYEYRVANGTLSGALLRPLHPIHGDLAATIADRIVTMIITLPVAALLIVVFKPAFHLNLWALLTFVPALLLAFVLRFLLSWVVAMIAFWTTRMTAIIQAYLAVMLFLSGQMTPLALLPGPIQLLAQVLPFRWIIAFPIDLLLGKLTPDAAATGLAMQALWSLVIAIALTFIWRIGLRKYSAVGA